MRGAYELKPDTPHGTQNDVLDKLNENHDKLHDWICIVMTVVLTMRIDSVNIQ